MSTEPPTYAWDTPTSDVVLLTGGPCPRRGFFYRDWLTTRAATRRMRTPIADAPCRRYAPTTDTHTTHHGTTRVWAHIDTDQWQRWGREYLTPEETGHHETRAAA